MSDLPGIDRQSFQTFLENAFAVQQSGLDLASLAAIIEIQRFTASEAFDLDRAMQMIADSALNVARASGSAIALLEEHELVCRAGSGTAAQEIGRHVAAVMSASPPADMRREILRVENAHSDTRIEAEICRQFGAMSLLMLPIYKNNDLAGVLQVLFADPHTFRAGEVRAYRLMIGALEDGMLRLQRRVEERALTVREPVSQTPFDLPQNLQSVENTARAMAAVAEAGRQSLAQPQPLPKRPSPPAERRPGVWQRYTTQLQRCDTFLERYATRFVAAVKVASNSLAGKVRTRADRLGDWDPAATVERGLGACKRYRGKVEGFAGAAAREARPVWVALNNRVRIRVQGPRWNSLAGAFRTRVNRPVKTRFQMGVAVLAAVVLGTVLWIGERNHAPDTAASLPERTTPESQPQAIPTPTTPVAITEPSVAPADLPKRGTPSSKGFKRVRVGANETDYVADDVTIRHFDGKPATRQAPKSVSVKEQRFGNDVTVRYFPDTRQVASQPAAERTRSQESR